MGSPFASHTQTTVPLPFDPPHTITIRRLTGLELERAQTEHLKNLVGGRSVRGWSAHFQRVLAGKATNADARAAIADPLAGFDRVVMVRAGLLAWSYPQPIKPELMPATSNGSFKVPGPDAIEDLDDDALDFIATEILRLTKPALFYTKEDDADAAKKSAADDAAPRVDRTRAATV